MVRLCRRMPCFLARASSAALKPWNASASPSDVSTLPSQPLQHEVLCAPFLTAMVKSICGCNQAFQIPSPSVK